MLKRGDKTAGHTYWLKEGVPPPLISVSPPQRKFGVFIVLFGGIFTCYKDTQLYLMYSNVFYEPRHTLLYFYDSRQIYPCFYDPGHILLYFFDPRLHLSRCFWAVYIIVVALSAISCFFLGLCNQSLNGFIWLTLNSSSAGGHFKNTYELLNPRALKIPLLYIYRILQFMGWIFCVEFQRFPLKFHTKYLTQTLKDVHFIHGWKCKSS